MVQAEEGSTNSRNSLCHIAHLDCITVFAIMTRAVHRDTWMMEPDYPVTVLHRLYKWNTPCAMAVYYRA